METKIYKNSAKFHLRPARMYIHIVLFIFLICMLVLALDQAQSDVIAAEHQRDLQVLHPGERRVILYGQRKVPREQQHLDLNKLISTTSSENNNIDVKAGCSSFDAGSSENLLNKNYIKLNNSDKMEQINVLNYACNDDWNKLPAFGNKYINPYRNKFPLTDLLNNMNEFNDITPLNENNMSLNNNFINIPEKNEENKFINIVLNGSCDSSDISINGSLQDSSTILFGKKSNDNKLDIGNNDLIEITSDGKTEKGLHKAAMQSSENELNNEEKVIATQTLSKHDSNIIGNLTNDLKKNSSFLQKLLDYSNGKYESYNNKWIENKAILPHTENINNVLQLPEAKFKNLFLSNYYTSGKFGLKNHYDTINNRLYVLPVILPESYLTNLMLFNPSRYKCLMKSLENNVPKNLGSTQRGRERYVEKTSSRPKLAATIKYIKKTSDSSKHMLVKNTSPLGERSHKETKKFKNTTNFVTTMPFRTVTNSDMELTINLLPSIRLKNIIQDISLFEIASKSSTAYKTSNIDNKSLENDNLAVTPVSNTTNINNDTINADFIKIMNEVLKLLNESKDQKNDSIQKNDNTSASKNLLKLGEQNYRTPSGQNIFEINDEFRVKNNKPDNFKNNPSIMIEEIEPFEYDRINNLTETDNFKNNPSLMIEEIEPFEYDRINDLTENSRRYNNCDDILSSILHETPNVESLILKYENVTVQKQPIINSENSEGGDFKLIQSLDSKKYRSNNKMTNNHDMIHQIDECLQKSNDEVLNGPKIYSLDKKPDSAICTDEFKNQPAVNYLNSALRKRSCNSTSNDGSTKVITDVNLHHEPIKFEYFSKILKDIYHNNNNSNCESSSEKNNVNFQTSSNNILMKKLSPTSHYSSSLGKICVRGPENLIPRKVDIIFPGLIKTVLRQVQPRDIHFLLQNDPETSGRETEDKSCFNRNELIAINSLKQQSILEQLRRINETLMKLQDDLNNGLLGKHNRTNNII